MNSYTIDASIYSLPDMNDLPQDERIKIYDDFLKNIYILKNICKHSKNDVKLYFFKNDILSIHRMQEKFKKENINKIRELSYKNNKSLIIDDLLSFYTDLIIELLNNISDKNYLNRKYIKYIIIDLFTSMTINDISYRNNIQSEPDINDIYQNTFKTEDLKKKVIYFAFLNKYIYRNSGLNKLVVNKNIPNNRMQVNVKIINVKHKFLINDIPKNNFEINKQLIELYEYKKINDRKIFDNIIESFNEAKNIFKDSLDFNEKVDKTIKEYNNNLFRLKKQYPENNAIKYHIVECPYTLYDNLDSLDRLLKYYKVTKNNIAMNKRMPIMERFIYNCYKHDEIVCKKCCALLRFYGYECSSEVSKESGRINNKQYRIHLKPYSYSIDKNFMAELSLRIYFRWDTDKIEIGYIGKHL